MAAGTKADAKPNELRGTLPAGTRLRNYELMSVLGHGGFGITYYARDTTLGREVAVKEYLPTTLALRENGSTVVPRSTQLAEDFIWGRERFLEEARILATLEGAPAVVRVYDFLEANGTAYMIMGLARGDTLEQRLKRDGKLPPAIVERMLDRLLDGLEAVHKAGFLHRDVKPANIILDANNNPTLIDFGASRASMADRTAAMTAIFTPRYAAAEQLTSDKQGPWTDIYGLSATLYHAITGKPPPSSLERALNDTYEPLARLSPGGLFAPARCRASMPAWRCGQRTVRNRSPIWRDVLSSTEEPDGTVTRPCSSARSPARSRSARPSRVATDARPGAGRRRVAAAVDAPAAPVGVCRIVLPPRSPLPAGTHRAVRRSGGGGPRPGVAADIWCSRRGSAPPPAPFGVRRPTTLRDCGGQSAGGAATGGRGSGQAKGGGRGAAEGGGRSAAEGSGRSPAERQRPRPSRRRRRRPAEGGSRSHSRRRRPRRSRRQRPRPSRRQRRRLSRKRRPKRKQKAEAEAKQKAAAEAQQKAEAEAAKQKAAAEAQQKADGGGQQKAAAEASRRRRLRPSRRQRPRLSRRQRPKRSRRRRPRPSRKQRPKPSRKRRPRPSRRPTAEAKQKADAEAKQKAEAEAAAQKAAEAAETALKLVQLDRQRIQVALTSLGFDTQGVDGVFGPRSREMITAGSGPQSADNRLPDGRATTGVAWRGRTGACKV